MSNRLWLGRQTAPLTHAVEMQLGKMLDEAGNNGLPVPYVTTAHLAHLQDIRPPVGDLPTMLASLADVRRFGLRTGDLLLAEGGDVGKSSVYRGPEGVIFQKTVHRLRARDQWDLRFVKWCLAAVRWSGWWEVENGSSTIRHLTSERLACTPMPVAPRDEQRRIADFLDDQVGRMDSVAAARARQIQLLDERVASLIGSQITTALGGAGHQMVPIKRHLKKLARPVVTADAQVVTAYRDGQVIARHLRRADGYTERWIEGSAMQGVLPGDVVVHGLDGFSGAIGTSESGGACSPANHVCQPMSGGDPDFYGRMLRILALSGYLSLYGGSARERAVDFRNWEKFASTPLPAVPAAMQAEIGTLLRGMRPLRRQVARLGEQLAERKRALITACVTGEFDVSTAGDRAADMALRGSAR